MKSDAIWEVLNVPFVPYSHKIVWVKSIEDLFRRFLWFTPATVLLFI